MHTRACERPRKGLWTPQPRERSWSGKLFTTHQYLKHCLFLNFIDEGAQQLVMSWQDPRRPSTVSAQDAADGWQRSPSIDEGVLRAAAQPGWHAADDDEITDDSGSDQLTDDEANGLPTTGRSNSEFLQQFARHSDMPIMHEPTRGRFDFADSATTTPYAPETPLSPEVVTGKLLKADDPTRYVMPQEAQRRPSSISAEDAADGWRRSASIDESVFATTPLDDEDLTIELDRIKPRSPQSSQDSGRRAAGRCGGWCSS